MTLPLAEEVREARRLAIRAESAMTWVHQAFREAETITILLETGRANDIDDLVIPGDATIEGVAAEFTELRDLVQMGPPTNASNEGRLHARAAQLNMLMAVLSPVAQEHEQRSTFVHNLQHEQAELLKAPEYAEIMAELATYAATRTHWVVEAERLSREAAALGPFLNSLTAMREELSTDIARIPESGAVERSVAKLRALVHIHAATSPEDSVLPDAAVLGDGPHSRADCEDALAALDEAARAVGATHRDLTQAQSQAHAHAQAATQWILDRTG